jgi:quercetin dioxygenase-like cupin family protein
VAGHIIQNPVSGERVRWLLTEADTGGRLTRADVRTRPGGGAPVPHRHPHSEERFEVLAGRMLVTVDGEPRVLLPGEAATVPAGAEHTWCNVGDGDLHFVLELDDPRGFEAMIEDVFAAARAGRMDGRGRLDLLTGALLLRKHAASLVPTSPPRAVQRLLVPPLALLARALGRGWRPHAPRSRPRPPSAPADDPPRRACRPRRRAGHRRRRPGHRAPRRQAMTRHRILAAALVAAAAAAAVPAAAGAATVAYEANGVLVYTAAPGE